MFSGPLTPNGVALRDVTLTKKYVQVLKLEPSKLIVSLCSCHFCTYHEIDVHLYRYVYIHTWSKTCSLLAIVINNAVLLMQVRGPSTYTAKEEQKGTEKKGKQLLQFHW